MASKKKKTEKGRHSFSARRQERKRKKKVQAYLHGDVKIPPSAHGRLSVQIGLIGFSENKKDFSPNKRGIILNLILLIVLILMFFSGLKR